MLRSPHVMPWTLIGAFVRILHSFFLKLFNPLVNLLYLLFLFLQIRLVWPSFPALDSTFTSVRFMAPFISVNTTFFFCVLFWFLVLLSNGLGSKLQGLQVLLNHGLQLTSLFHFADFQSFSLIEILSSSMLSDLQIVVEALSAEPWKLSLIIHLVILRDFSWLFSFLLGQSGYSDFITLRQR